MTLFVLAAAVLSQTFSPPPMVPARDDSMRAPAVSSAPSSAVSEELVARATAPEERRRLFEVAIPGAIVALGGWIGGWVTFFDSISCRSTGWFGVDCNSASMLLLMPQLGPWLAIGIGGTNDPWFAQNLGLGIAQAAGLIAMVSGFALSVPVGGGDVAMNIAPTGTGVALGGTF